MTTAFKQHSSADLRLQFYTVAVRSPADIDSMKPARPGVVDLRLLGDAAMQRIRAMAENCQLANAVRITGDTKMLAEKGEFFMQAPARFADDIRQLDGIKSVKTPLNPRRQPRRAAL
jgi:hypothetical protein